jgi:flagellar biosynthesis protein FlhA
MVLRTDVALGVGVMALVVMLFLPMPVWLLDFMLAVSVTSSVMILMTALLIKKPLEFSAFPTVLLLSTLLRLGLNIASTRLILSEGHAGPDAAGEIIAAFGDFVMQGNFVIGVIVFAILVIVNFVVISKGSGRIAEVAARFTLDAMPGKQMAVDADLSSGLINEDEARRRRKELEGESNFFGAMDGASKFVRGDAIAGLIITFINVIAGMIIGVAQQGMEFGAAADAYTRLTVGDGLVSQIPALITSIAAGLLVSKAGVEGGADKALGAQLAAHPQGLAMVSATAFGAALLPGMPFIPFIIMAGATGGLAWFVWRERIEAESAAARGEARASASTPVPEPTPESALAVDELRIELGFNLIALINETQGRKLTEQIKAVRRQIASEFGFIAPSVRIVDNVELDADSYRIVLKETEIGRGRLKLRHQLAMDPTGGLARIPGEQVLEPVFGLPALWIDEALREEASVRGYTVVDPATVLTTHFTELVKENMAELLSFAATKKLVDELPKEQRALVDDIVPSQISMSGIQRVLQALLRERVSIRDLATIVEGVAEGATRGADLVTLTEQVRGRLARQLCTAHQATDGSLPVITLTPQWEQTLGGALVGEGGQRQLALEPSRLHQFANALRQAFDDAAARGETPVLLTSATVRPYVRALVERFRPLTTVMSQHEIHPRARLRAAGAI